MAKEKPQHEPNAEDKAEATTPTQADVYEANAAGANPAKAAQKRRRSAPKKKGASTAAEPDEGPEDDELAPPIPDVKDPELAVGTGRSSQDDLADEVKTLTRRVDKLEKRLKKSKKK